MAESLDYVLQPDGTYKWEVVEHAKEANETPAPKVTKKKVAKKKTTNPLSE